MIPHGCRVVLRPRSPLEVIDLAVRLVQVEAGRFGRTALVVLLPVWLAAAVVAEVTMQRTLVGAVLLLLAPALQAPFTLLGARVLFATDVRVRDVLREARRALGAVVVDVVLKAIALVVGVTSAGLLWLPVHALVLFHPETALLERKATGGALRRAGTLAGDQLGKVLVGSILSVGIGVWCVVAAEALMQAIVRWVLQLGTSFGVATDGTVTIWTMLGLVLAQPVVAVFRLLLYLDVRTVTEGWDLQVAFRAAAEET